jgi:hypothetical protein
MDKPLQQPVHSFIQIFAGHMYSICRQLVEVKISSENWQFKYISNLVWITKPSMTKRNQFAEITEGIDALQAQQQGKRTLRTKPNPAQLGTRPRQAQCAGQLAHQNAGALSGCGEAVGDGLTFR